MTGALLASAVCGAADKVASPAPGVELASIDAFRSASPNWQDAGELAGNPRQDKVLQTKPGVGLLVCRPRGEAPEQLVSKAEHGDVALDLEVLLSPGSAVSVFLHGRYAVNIGDSWGVRLPGSQDCGAIARRSGDLAPRGNACRAPGLWQRLQIEFQAPRFDPAGQKTTNARFVKIALNDFVIHENVEMPEPSPNAAFPNEAATAPLMIAGHRGAIAVRRMVQGPPVMRSPLPAPARRANPEEELPVNATGGKPIPVEPTRGKVRLQRSFVPFEPRKRLYAINVGYPAGVHYAYDLEAGALLRVWRGGFLDTVEMWDDRGRSQFAKPTGPSLTLNAKPTVAFIEYPQINGAADQPEAQYSSQGYVLEPGGQPVFLATLTGIKIRDRIAPAVRQPGLHRLIELEGAPAVWETWILLAEGETITAQSDGAGWVIGDRSHYLDWPIESRHRPVVRSHGDRQQLLLRLTKATFEVPVSYTLVW